MNQSLFQVLDNDFRQSKINRHFKVSEYFKLLHDKFVDRHDRIKYFTLTDVIDVERKDQLLLNLQYINLVYGNVYDYETFCLHLEEFLTNFLNYEMTTGNCSEHFVHNITVIYDKLNKSLN